MEESECDFERTGWRNTHRPPTPESNAGRAAGHKPLGSNKTLGRNSAEMSPNSADEIRIMHMFNEQATIADTAQGGSSPKFEHNCYWYGMESREQTPGPISLESDFFVSLKLAAVLTLIFVAVTILLVSSNQSEPLLVRPDSTKFNRHHSLNHKLRLFFPSQSESFWTALENVFNHHLTDPAETLEAWLVGVGFEDSWNTMFCLSRIIARLLLVTDGDRAPDVVSKMLDYSHILLSQPSPSPRPGTCVIVIAESVRNQTCAITLSLHSATSLRAAATTLISVQPANMGPEQEMFLNNCVLRILHHLNHTAPTSAEMPNTPIVVVKPENYLESGFLC